jgi:hypothetical protein
MARQNLKDKPRNQDCRSMREWLGETVFRNENKASYFRKEYLNKKYEPFSVHPS